MYLKCLLASRFTLFRYLHWFGSCNHCILACYLWSNKAKHSLSIHAYLEGNVSVSHEGQVLRWGVVNFSPNPQPGGPPLAGCSRLLIECIRIFPPYWRLCYEIWYPFKTNLVILLTKCVVFVAHVFSRITFHFCSLVINYKVRETLMCISIKIC